MSSHSNPWDQREFEVLYTHLDADRRREDERLLSIAFNAAAHSPTLKQEMDWARKNDIRFFVDHTCQHYRGYYTPGSGVVALALASARDPDLAPDILAHEIRHAWQDFHHLHPTIPGMPLSDFIINSCLIEADATAFERRVGQERREEIVLPHQKHVEDWYASEKPAVYGERIALKYGAREKLGVTPLDCRLEFDPKAIVPFFDARMTHHRRINTLSLDMSGRESFNSAASPGFTDRILDPAQAKRFFDRNRAAPDPLLTAICQREEIRQSWILDL